MLLDSAMLRVRLRVVVSSGVLEMLREVVALEDDVAVLVNDGWMLRLFDGVVDANELCVTEALQGVTE